MRIWGVVVNRAMRIMRIIGGRATIGRSANDPERAHHATQHRTKPRSPTITEARTDPGQTPGMRCPRRQTSIGLSAHLNHLPVPAAMCRSGVQTNLGHAPSSPASPVFTILAPKTDSGRTAPTCPPSAGDRPLLLMLPFPPLPANSTLPCQKDAPLPS